MSQNDNVYSFNVSDDKHTVEIDFLGHTLTGCITASFVNHYDKYITKFLKKLQITNSGATVDLSRVSDENKLLAKKFIIDGWDFVNAEKPEIQELFVNYLCDNVIQPEVEKFKKKYKLM